MTAVIVLACVTWTGLAMAEPAEITQTIQVGEKLELAQLVVESGQESYEVDLITPGGTHWSHTQDDYEQGYVYVTLPGQRIWLLNEMPPGTYTLVIQGPAEGSYRSFVKEKIDKPEVQWIAPANTEVKLTDFSSISLAWSSTGDRISGHDEISFYLQPAAGGERFPVGNARISQHQHELRIPERLIDGEYVLTAEAENYTAEPQQLDPQVRIKLNRGVNPAGIEIATATPRGGLLDLQLKLPNDVRLEWVELALVPAGQPAQPEWLRLHRDELYQDEEVRDLYYAAVEAEQSGEYTVMVRWVDAQGLPGPITRKEAISLDIRDWSLDKVEWSLEEGLTNVRTAEVRVTLQRASTVQLVEGTNILFDQRVEPAAEPVVITIPLQEGDRAIELFVGDDFGNVKSFGRRFIVDHTPPRLELIQPLPSHKELLGGFASGFAEPGSTVWVNGEQAVVDAAGYFRMDTSSRRVEIRAADESGNETHYTWEPEAGGGMPQWLWIAGGAVLLAAAAGLIWFRRRS